MRDPEPSSKIGRLKRRADFLRAAKGKRCHMGAMTVQAAPAKEPGVRIGFTLTRKVGNAVVRNRARRRLKEAVRLSPDLPVAADHDYVVIGRIEAVRLPFEALKRDLARAIRGVRERRQRPRDGKPPTEAHLSAETRSKRTRPAP